MDKNFYNEASAKKLGWDPSWFGVSFFDDELVEAIEQWQESHSISADGLCGPMTYRRVWTERQSKISDYMPRSDKFSIYKNSSASCKDKYIVHNSTPIPIAWDKVVLWDEPGGLKIKPGKYYDYAGKPDRKPTMFVNHWDVCLDAESCAKVLNKRGISVHFCIDNDGTIYQLLDTQHGAWHAGNTQGNKKGIGVEISNAYYLKYQGWYERNGFGSRPISSDAVVHGRKLEPHLDFYPVQLEALKALWVAVHKGLDIPLEAPLLPDGRLSTSVDSRVSQGRFKGFVNHYNFTQNKIDCAGLDLIALIEECK